MLTNSLTFFEYDKLQTWLPVSTQCNYLHVSVFQNLMHLSAVPPPLHIIPCWCGFQAIALTAATCSLNFTNGFEYDPLCQMSNLLSLPPEASCCSSGLHLSPHTSYLCPSSFAKKSCFDRISLWRIHLSLEPLLKNEFVQAMHPILPSCPLYDFTILYLVTSQFCRIPFEVPTARWFPVLLQLTLVICSEGPKSYNLVTLLVDALHK